ncbi:MAG: efflux RND transporter periplasmic adaptor subunit [Deltaproteobacteria bacterium]|nr:efflux RND transporter periplasmic adaptor subunit [Deltaproteobacteria bacterium]
MTDDPVRGWAFARYCIPLVVLLATVAGCRDHVGAGLKMPPVLVATQKAARSTMEDTRRFTGFTYPWEARGVGFMVAGRVTSIKVDEGDHVKKGQTLATLDPSDYALQEQLARIQVEALEPNFQRVDGLVKEKALSEAKLDELRGKYQAALTQRKQARRQVEYTRLAAPSDGVVMERKTSVGQVIGAGMPAVVLLDLSRLKVKFGVTQQDLHLFEKGRELPLTFPGVEREYTGRIDGVSVVPDPKTRTYEVSVAVDNGDGQLRAGMLSHVSVATRKVSGIFVPLLAVKRDRGQGTVVYLFDPDTRKVVQRPVKLGARFKDRVLVTEGLKDGDELIVEGQGFVNPGDEVRAR